MHFFENIYICFFFLIYISSATVIKKLVFWSSIFRNDSWNEIISRDMRFGYCIPKVIIARVGVTNTVTEKQRSVTCCYLSYYSFPLSHYADSTCCRYLCIYHAIPRKFQVECQDNEHEWADRWTGIRLLHFSSSRNHRSAPSSANFRPNYRMEWTDAVAESRRGSNRTRTVVYRINQFGSYIFDPVVYIRQRNVFLLAGKNKFLCLICAVSWEPVETFYRAARFYL